MTEAPKYPKCDAKRGTPLNEECGGRRFSGPADSNLRCPRCGDGWVGSDEDVANAWRAFVEFEATQIEPAAPASADPAQQPGACSPACDSRPKAAFAPPG
jgi:hypothetical protein